MASRKNSIHPKMDPANRAKQFMPFDALKGFREALAEKERQVVSKKELPQERKEELNLKLQQLQKGERITVEFFYQEAYKKLTGVVSGIDEINRGLKLEDWTIPFENILDFYTDELL